MMRRRFLSLLGAATTAPLMPTQALAAAPVAAPYSAAAMHGAILHAQTSSHVSTFGLAQILKVPMPQAEALMDDMAQRGIIAPLNGLRTNSRWATSRIHHRHFAKLRQTTKPEPPKADHSDAKEAARQDPDLMMAHLHKLCRAYGMTIAA